MSATLIIDIADGLIDQPRSITAHGLTRGEARLTADFTHADGSVWHSEAVFSIPQSGVLDVARATPLSGDWDSPEPMAPVWALRRVSPALDITLSDSLETRHITLCIEDSSGAVSETTLTQQLLAPGVTRQEIRDNGLSATLFTPSGDGPYPLVVVLNGSGGGTPEQRAVLFAAKGYQALALAYFNAPGRPDYLSATPLEYFHQALTWAAETLHPKNDFIAVVGHSRGGELALLLGSLFPEQVSAVIGYVPSDVIHGTLRAGRPGEPRDATAWTWRGQPLRNIWQGNPVADWHSFDHPPKPGVYICQAPAFVTVEQDPQHLAAARIPVERIAGPVLLISATDDGFWPSVNYCERVVATLAAHQHRWPVVHVCNKGAGHAIGFPWIPTSEIARAHPVAGVVIDGGGTPAANARANRESWQRVLAFLDTATREVQV